MARTKRVETTKATIIKRLNNLLLLGAALLVLSCDGSIFHNYRSVNGGWSRGDTLRFVCPPVGGEVPLTADVSVGVRYSAAYNYKTLPLSITARIGCETIACDTVFCDIYSSNGRRNGATGGLLYQAEFPVPGMQVQLSDTLSLSVVHLLPDSLLSGVSDVGIRLVPPCRHQCAGK